MNLISKTFSLAVLTGILSLLSPTSSQAQTTPEMQTMPDNIVSQSTDSEQLRQEYHQTLGQMQQMLGRMHQQVDRAVPRTTATTPSTTGANNGTDGANVGSA